MGARLSRGSSLVSVDTCAVVFGRVLVLWDLREGFSFMKSEGTGPWTRFKPVPRSGRLLDRRLQCGRQFPGRPGAEAAAHTPAPLEGGSVRFRRPVRTPKCILM